MGKREYLIHFSLLSSRDIDELEITKALSTLKDAEITGFSIEAVNKPIVIQQIEPLEDVIYSINGEPHKLSYKNDDYISLVSGWTNNDIKIATSMWPILVDSSNISLYKDINVNGNVFLRNDVVVSENVIEGTPEGQFAYLKIMASKGTSGKVLSLDLHNHTATVAFNCDLTCNAFNIQTGDICVRTYLLKDAIVPLDNLIAE